MTLVNSKRDRIRDLAEAAIRKAGGPMHNTDLADFILPKLQTGESASAKDINTALHDDPQGRFTRVGKGTWALVRAR